MDPTIGTDIRSNISRKCPKWSWMKKKMENNFKKCQTLKSQAQIELQTSCWNNLMLSAITTSQDIHWTDPRGKGSGWMAQRRKHIFLPKIWRNPTFSQIPTNNMPTNNIQTSNRNHDRNDEPSQNVTRRFGGRTKGMWEVVMEQLTTYYWTRPNLKIAKCEEPYCPPPG